MSAKKKFSGLSARPSARATAEWMLAAATLFWGWTFPVVKDAVAHMPVFAFLAVRFALAAVLMLPLLLRAARRSAGAAGEPADDRGEGRGEGGGFSRRSLAAGGVLGLLLFSVFAFQTLGLERTSAAKCGFVTGLNVAWVALLSGALLRRGAARAWGATALAVGGLWLLTAPEASSFNFGDFLTLVCSLFIALHIMTLDRLGGKHSSAELAFTQFVVVALASLAASLAAEPRFFPAEWGGDLIFAFALTALGATVFSFWAQTHFQHRTTPLRAGLIFILEPAFATAFAVLFYGERLPPTAWLGAALMLGAMAFFTGAAPHSPHPAAPATDAAKGEKNQANK